MVQSVVASLENAAEASEFAIRCDFGSLRSSMWCRLRVKRVEVVLTEVAQRGAFPMEEAAYIGLFAAAGVEVGIGGAVTAVRQTANGPPRG